MDVGDTQTRRNCSAKDAAKKWRNWPRPPRNSRANCKVGPPVEHSDRFYAVPPPAPTHRATMIANKPLVQQFIVPSATASRPDHGISPGDDGPIEPKDSTWLPPMRGLPHRRRPNQHVATSRTPSPDVQLQPHLGPSVHTMNADDQIDLLRRTNYMRIDKASETIAVQYCCSIHYHRCLVLEGVRRAALRNIASLNKTKSDSIIDAATARLYSRKYNAPVEVILEDLNRICRDMFRIFMNSLWEVYLCLLYERIAGIQAIGYQEFQLPLHTSHRLLGFQHRSVDAFARI